MKSNTPLSLRDISPKGETILIHFVIFSPPGGSARRACPALAGARGSILLSELQILSLHPFSEPFH